MYYKQRQRKWRSFCYKNFKKFLQESTLHGLRFIGDESISLWERGFFLFAFVAALMTTGFLMSHLYTKWNLTPIIIVTNPYPTSISSIPFPSITLCNMNHLLLSKVSDYSKKSYERAIVDMICHEGNENENSTYYKNNNLSITEFIHKHAQPCSDMLISCQFNSLYYNCSDLFQESITDEGLCCAFNMVDPKFLYKIPHRTNKEYKKIDKAIPVNWNPEVGYKKGHPNEDYPKTSDDIGVSMGLSLVLDAQVYEYYCSSTNGPGFKIDLQNPIEAPRVKEIGLTIPPGQDTRFRVTAHSSSANHNILQFNRSVRKCLFDVESNLMFYRYYTRKNCVNECQAEFVYEICKCIPYYLPWVVANASICEAPQSFCVKEVKKTWLRSASIACRQKCLENCFGLTYTASSYSAPLSQGNYIIDDIKKLENYSLEYMRDNIATVNIFFHEFVFYGEDQNVYVGFNEFLSNIGGIFGLFLGLSFISVIEIFYYGIICPILKWIQLGNDQNELIGVPKENLNTLIWYNQALYPNKQKHLQNGLLTYRQQKLEKTQNQFKKNSEIKIFERLQNLQ